MGPSLKNLTMKMIRKNLRERGHAIKASMTLKKKSLVRMKMTRFLLNKNWLQLR